MKAGLSVVMFALFSALVSAGDFVSDSTYWLVSSFAQTDNTLIPLAHTHSARIGRRAAAEADRLMAMFFAIECDIENANKRLSYAYMRDPENPAIEQARNEMSLYLVERSKEWWLEGMVAEGYTFMQSSRGFLYRAHLTSAKINYARALECDKDNPLARRGQERVSQKLEESNIFIE